jgi:hypothetical protein
VAISNKDVEVLSEALFCYYFAIYRKNKQGIYNHAEWNFIKNSADLLSFTNKFGITSMVDHVNNDPAFVSRLPKVLEFLVNRKSFWANALKSQMQAFFTNAKLKSGGNYFIMRADMIPKDYDPYTAYNELSQKVRGKLGFRGTIDKDKWNPSDVWIFTKQSANSLRDFISLFKNQLLNQPEYSVKMMEKLNNKIYSLYKEGSLYPVSLKAPTGNAKVVFENDVTSDIVKVVKYDEIDFSTNNQDAKIKFSVDLVDKESGRKIKPQYIKGIIKTKTVLSGGARLEIEAGGAARYGSMGTENYQYLIRETDRSGILSLNRIRNKKEFFDLKNKYWTKTGGAQWLARAEYVKEFQRNPEGFRKEIEPYTQELFKHINGTLWDSASIEMKARSPEEAYLNKTHAGEVAVAVEDITSNIMRDITVENLFNLAASQSFGAGVSLSQLQTRMKMQKRMSKELKEEFQTIDVSSSKKLWTSCFYLVVK